MRFSLDLGFVLRHMGNEYDEELEDYGSDVIWEIMKMLLNGELEFYIDDGFLVLDVPDELLEEEGRS
jgi:hypothetical protein